MWGCMSVWNTKQYTSQMIEEIALRHLFPQSIMGNQCKSDRWKYYGVLLEVQIIYEGFRDGPIMQLPHVNGMKVRSIELVA